MRYDNSRTLSTRYVQIPPERLPSCGPPNKAPAWSVSSAAACCPGALNTLPPAVLKPPSSRAKTSLKQC